MFGYAMGAGLGAKGVRPGEGLREVFDQELSFAWVAGYTIYAKCEWIYVCSRDAHRKCLRNIVIRVFDRLCPRRVCWLINGGQDSGIDGADLAFATSLSESGSSCAQSSLEHA